MKRLKLDEIVEIAIKEGILPPASKPLSALHPWPVLVLTALGAWLSAIPLIVFIGLLFSSFIEHGPGGYILGIATLSGAVWLLRQTKLSLFVEQLGFPILLVGLCLLGFALSRDLPNAATAAVQALVVLSIAWLVPRTWLRVLLGAAMAVLLGNLIRAFDGSGQDAPDWLFTFYSIAGFWAGLVLIQGYCFGKGDKASMAVALEAIATGVGITVLCELALYTGGTFMIGDLHRLLTGPGIDRAGVMPVASFLLTLVAGYWAAHRSKSLRQAWYAASVIVLACLAWFAPGLGAILGILAVCITSSRWGLAIFAALAGWWSIGAFYYQLEWPLTTKAIVLMLAGAAFGAIARILIPASPDTVQSGTASAHAMPKILPSLALIGVAVLLAINVSIWQKEALIENGKPVFVELAPVDPRSLVQGDYMRLNFTLPRLASGDANKSAYAVAQQDKRGIATLTRMDDGSRLAPGEFLMELVPKDRRLVLVTDAWFFEEGEGQRWGKARYGEFRVDDKGHALLVGLRGPQLEKL